MTQADSIGQLRERSSSKWTAFEPDVLPMFVAEMDFPLAPAIQDALRHAIEIGDTGYVNTGNKDAAVAFSRFARDTWGWEPDPERMAYTTDVGVVIVESLRRLISPGDGVIIMPPVYPPFWDFVTEAGGRVVEVPLLDDGERFALDLVGIDRALADGARSVLLCNPHNPVGLVHDREALVELSRIVAVHGASVVSDEIHAPLVHRGVTFTPYLTVSDAAREHGIAAESGSKAFNLAGLKAAMFVAASESMAKLIRSLPEEVGYRTGLFGIIATREGFANSRDWLSDTVAKVEENFALLASLLEEYLPSVRMRRAQASYLAWLDLRSLGWGEDPDRHVLKYGRLALSNGPKFGAPGRGYARMNLACAPETIREAVRRLVRAGDARS